MAYGLVVTVPPAEEPVTLAEAKTHLRVDHAYDDALILTLVGAARRLAEAETGRRWVTQTLTLSADDFPRAGWLVPGGRYRPNPLFLQVEPVQSVAAVRYYDAAGVQQTLAAPALWLAHAPPLVAPAPGAAWPATQPGRPGAVEVEFVAGYGGAALVPEDAKAAILLAVGDWYEHRGDSPDPHPHGLPAAAGRLLGPLRTGSYS